MYCIAHLLVYLLIKWASQVALVVKDLQKTLEKQVGSLGQQDPLEEGMATHSSILGWRTHEQSLMGYSL